MFKMFKMFKFKMFKKTRKVKVGGYFKGSEIVSMIVFDGKGFAVVNTYTAKYVVDVERPRRFVKIDNDDCNKAIQEFLRVYNSKTN